MPINPPRDRASVSNVMEIGEYKYGVILIYTALLILKSTHVLT